MSGLTIVRRHVRSRVSENCRDWNSLNNIFHEPERTPVRALPSEVCPLVVFSPCIIKVIQKQSKIITDITYLSVFLFSFLEKTVKI